MTSTVPPPSTSLHRQAATNKLHLANLEHLFRNRGAVDTNSSPVPAWRKQRATASPLLRLPSFLKRAKGREAAMAMEEFESDEPSPRGDIAADWRRLHGADDWLGLLDPLHPDLRREIVRYGEFVDAAHAAFLAAPGDADVVPQLQAGAYRVTAPLFATSSVRLPRWLGPAAPQRTSLVGYVAVCECPNEVRRMGRRDIVVALRGTCTLLEWAENVRVGLVPAIHDHDAGSTSLEPKVERGFWNLYKTAGRDSQSLSETVVSEVRRLLKNHEGEEVSITVTGHSLGAALAVLIADELTGLPAPTPAVAVFSFGGPRVGDGAFAERVEARGARVLRVVNARDVVPRFPPASYSYADVGRELRVDSRASPYLRADADAACCHDLEAYIHLVDGFMGLNRPFRANAKRLLKNQGGNNVKQLYVSSNAVDMAAGSPLVRVECVS